MASDKAKKGGVSDKARNWMWLALSLAAAIIVWTILSVLPSTSRSFPNIIVVFQQIPVMIERGVLFKDIQSSLISVGLGYLLGFVIALPVAILMAWYNPFRRIVEPWIQFIRNIPPLAYVPLIVIAAGVGRKPQVIVITIATFLIMWSQGQGHLHPRPGTGQPALHPHRRPSGRLRRAHDAHRRGVDGSVRRTWNEDQES